MPYRKRMSQDKTEFARQMRRDPSPPERLVWERIRNNALGVRARQQAPMLGWIADFYIPAWRLVIEIDGKQHSPEADARRDQAMHRHGLRVLRFPASRVFANPDAVVARIRQAGLSHGDTPDCRGGVPASRSRPRD